MNTVKIEKGHVKMIAHRGLSGIEAENTNAAFIAAANRSYYGIETDIHRTLDNRFVVCHDDSLNRVAGVKISVESTPLSVLQDVVLFDKDGSKGREDLRVSTLENYISICKKYGKQCVLELKSDFTNQEISDIVGIIKDYGYLENVIFISFKYSNLVKVRSIRPTQPVQFLIKDFTDEIIDRLIAEGIDADVKYTSLNKGVIDLLHENGLKVNCWTVDSKEAAETLIGMGVDYITTNILE
ncbi:MAG: hypothetical protein IJ292_01905 [Clostridia bacterium]|nr:hypothetical protein [Clostridia bacterium]